MRKFCCKTKYFGICPHAGGNFVCITVCLCGYVCASASVCIAHKLKCARDILLLLLFCLGVSEFLCCAVAAKLQPLGAVNLVNASGGRACPSPNPTPPSSLPRPHAGKHTGAKESMPKCSWQLAVVCHFVAVRKFYCACRCLFPLLPPRCCCCGCCGHSLKFVAKSVYWFAMCNSHSMKIELFLWLLIGLQQGEAGKYGGCSAPGANPVFACKATARLDARNLAHMLPVLAH